MFSRLRKFLPNHSFFLFGPRGVGKSTLLAERYNSKKCLWLDLLDTKVEEQFFHDPGQLYSIVTAMEPDTCYVIIDEIQKVPKLLDEVHRLIEEKKQLFILTGSSARKLYPINFKSGLFCSAKSPGLNRSKMSPYYNIGSFSIFQPRGFGAQKSPLLKLIGYKRGGANLLAGRAFVYNLFSLSCFELGDKFVLDKALHWGTLPKIFSLESDAEKEEFLRAYANTYLKEEIVDEQLVRKLGPFRRFLEVAAQCNGKVINYANIARDVGVDEKTVKEYFIILEDTLIGFFLEPFHNSFRKRLVEKPKFYFFDTGVVRALARQLSVPLLPKTPAYGEAFEHYVLLEFMKLASYFQPEYRFSFILTVSGVEVDLVVERPGKPLLCIEVKSSDRVNEEDIRSFASLTKDIPDCEAVVLSQDRFTKRFDHVCCYPWQQALKEYFPELLAITSPVHSSRA